MISKTISYRTSSEDDDCLVTVRYIGAIFYLRWSPSDLALVPDLLSNYLAQLEQLKDDDVYADYSGLVLPFKPLMDQLAPTGRQVPFTLYEYLYPQWFQLKATAAKDCQTILPVQLKGEDPFCRLGIPTSSFQLDKLDLNNWVPRWFSSHDIELPADAKEHPLLQSPSRVIERQSQTECFFKGLGPGHKGTIDELVAFRAIDEATKRGALAPDARICRLYGLIIDTLGPRAPDQRIVGMLLNYIEPKRHGILGTLHYIAYDEQNHKHFHSWADDLSDTLGQLYQAGCVWGDAKPENVLVDKDNKV
ncbi:hypothetical protein CCM_03571 [Cordyceps militaris CM01]|uniref:Protein kinase domain-containing protein n=1 Tax=Cordyceps militaris (strain CM01) TaxID=983644 RepID=G3JBJ4_CORMM|nr:uncharacterized protein CCM_03571 [Cordyceps militaris CM01]EGX95299.1 hypothetical protein CCM_03571 [Cordyceps militaris CM01]